MDALILAAGKGTRMKSAHAKVLHEILGRPMLGYVLDALKDAGAKSAAVVIGANAEEVRAFLKKDTAALKLKSVTVLQKEQRGTGHAVLMAKKIFQGKKSDLLIWPGDMPLLKTETIKAFIKAHEAAGADASVLSAKVSEPQGYGRIVRRGDVFFSIKEELDATDTERQIDEINTGIYLFKTGKLMEALQKLKPANAKNELYLTDTLEILREQGAVIEAHCLASGEEAQGINSRLQLADAARIVALREARRHMEAGVTLVDPLQTYIEPGVEIGQDTVVLPWTYIESGVKIGKSCHIGPFAKIRSQTVIGNQTTIGSFVEVNRSKICDGVSAKHLAYLGDAEVGSGSNIGAGTITANYDGKKKHPTKIGKNVLIGSNTVLVAPVVLGDGVRTGAGSVVLAGSKLPKNAVVVGVPARKVSKK